MLLSGEHRAVTVSIGRIDANDAVPSDVFSEALDHGSLRWPKKDLPAYPLVYSPFASPDYSRRMSETPTESRLSPPRRGSNIRLETSTEQSGRPQGAGR